MGTKIHIPAFIAAIFLFCGFSNIVASDVCRILPPFDSKMKLDKFVTIKDARLPGSKEGRYLIFQVANKKIADTLDIPRFYPLIGPAQLRKTRWQFTVVIIDSRFLGRRFGILSPRAFQTRNVIVQKDFLHQVGPNAAGASLF
jgi:hypothetical protein